MATYFNISVEEDLTEEAAAELLEEFEEEIGRLGFTLDDSSFYSEFYADEDVLFEELNSIFPAGEVE